MSTDAGAEVKTVSDLVEKLEELDLDSVEYFEESNKELIRGLVGESVNYWNAVERFERSMDWGKPLHDLRDFTNRADFGVFAPEDAADKLLEGAENYLAATLHLEGEGDYVAKVWRPDGLELVLESNGLDEVYQHIDDYVLGNGRIFVVPSSDYDGMMWASRTTALISSDQFIMIPRKEGKVHGQMDSEVQNEIDHAFQHDDIRESETPEGKRVEIYPGSGYDRIGAQDLDGEVVLIGDGEVIESYDGFSLKGGDTYGGELYSQSRDNLQADLIRGDKEDQE